MFGQNFKYLPQIFFDLWLNIMKGFHGNLSTTNFTGFIKFSGGFFQAWKNH